MKGINYVGSTKNIKRRCQKHKSNCWNENSKEYNLLTYQYIREKNIKIELEILFCYKGNCSKRIRKLVEQFYINKHDSVKNGLNDRKAFGHNKKRIKETKNKSQKEYSEKNKEKIKQKRKIYCEENKDKIKETHKKHYEKNKDELKKRSKKYYEKNKDKISQKGKIKIKCCICGALIRKTDIKKHQRSKKCLKAKNSNISKEELDFKYDQNAYNEEGEFLEWY